MTTPPRAPSPSAGYPPPCGLYDPAWEHDACGVGLLCHLHGRPSHAIVRDALRILNNLSHRGAVGADRKTGDGAGILIQMPDAFLRTRCAEAGVRLPDPHAYGAGLVFLPRDAGQRRRCVELVETAVRAEGQVPLGWREVPVNHEVLGETARRAEPVIRQVLVGRGPGLADEAAFERKLYVIRKVLERTLRESDLPERRFFYLPSLSARTLVYKGLLLADQVEAFFPDLGDPDLASSLALVHQRYSTNTFPTWDLAQPFRFLCHNGEINTLRGNINWFNAAQGLFRSPRFGDDMAKLIPVLTPGASDSAILDNALELLVHTGRSLPHAIMMLIPEAWQNHATMSDEKKAFYEYHSCLVEPWDGPASIPFTDGRVVGAVLDRNGLRPSRYTVTKDGLVVMASETGVLEDLDPANVLAKGRLQPGRMFLVDMEQGRIVDDEEIKHEICRRRPYRQWLRDNLVELRRLPPAPPPPAEEPAALRRRQQAFGYTLEDLKVVLEPMAARAEEATGSMGTDTPLAVLSDQPQLLPSYFKQLFAQVTNPPLDAIREEVVTSLLTHTGASRNLFEETPGHCRQIRLESPVLTNAEMARLRVIGLHGYRSITLPMRYPVGAGGPGLVRALDELCAAASQAIDEGYNVLILSDREIGPAFAPLPALLATAGVHHHLVRGLRRTRVALAVESGEPREVHHFALLFGYGASAVNPYLALDTIAELARTGVLADVEADDAEANYLKAVRKGLLKVMSKMGIATLLSYRGAQIFEAVGLGPALIERCFPGTPSRVGGIGFDEVAEEARRRHAEAWPAREIPARLELGVGGQYQWRRTGEAHLLDPLAIARLQQAVRDDDPGLYREFSGRINRAGGPWFTLRGLLEFRPAEAPVPLDEVEPWTAVVRRFKTGAMSYGSISQEAHETLALAMNRLGGKSNSGEGGEAPERYRPDAAGNWRRSAIKQVASGRFGVTCHYLVSARELQIKMAQGAKPGEGGQLPGFKVYPWIAKTRHATPYVTLISPPPHHDIYSIEDLAQLIHDLKNANSEARVSVKLVAAVGVGTVAAGVSKGKADVVLISGYDGGTGASPQSSIKHAGLPWELGLAETHQTLVLNDLRSRITVECDGKLLTGRDVAIACLLGAEEFGFSAGPLVSLGCVMMRVCHLNTCPVGIATQDPELRRKFRGRPEHVIRYFRFVAEELRGIMAQLGFRTVDEMVGRVDRLAARSGVDHWKARHLDLGLLLHRPAVPPGVGVRCTQAQQHGLENALDHVLLEKARPAFERRQKVEVDLPIRNIHRTVGTLLSQRIARRYGAEGLPEDTITVRCAGSAGQSFGAFAVRGVTLRVEGDANDYFGKGLSGARLVIFPPRAATFVPEENVLVGNVALYGATGGEAFIRGLAGERFAVRNSGARAVVEGVGDHGCEYMTGGRVVILGPTGRNFAAGMSGGIAYVLDAAGDFGRWHCNRGMVELEPVATAEDRAELRELVELHLRHTQSSVAQRVLDRWDECLPQFVKVMPLDYKRALVITAHQPAAGPAGAAPG